MDLEIFSFLLISQFRKFILHNKVIYKIGTTQSQENSAQRFGENYLINHLAKFMQDRTKR